jgi:hypothetical protein
MKTGPPRPKSVFQVIIYEGFAAEVQKSLAATIGHAAHSRGVEIPPTNCPKTNAPRRRKGAKENAKKRSTPESNSFSSRLPSRFRAFAAHGIFVATKARVDTATLVFTLPKL